MFRYVVVWVCLMSIYFELFLSYIFHAPEVEVSAGLPPSALLKVSRLVLLYDSVELSAVPLKVIVQRVAVW